MTSPALAWTEDQLEAAIRELLKYEPAGSVLIYHTHDSRRSDAGFPDLVIVGPTGILWRELKAEKGKIRPAQLDWFDALRNAGADAGFWLPRDWVSGRIWTELRQIGCQRVPTTPNALPDPL